MASKKRAKKTSTRSAKQPAPKQAALVMREEMDSARDPAMKRALREWMNSHNKPGHMVAAFADDVKNVTSLRRPSGIMGLDIDCGGGLPAGRMSVITGPDGAGKSFLMIKYMAMHQRLYRDKSVVGIAAIEPFDYKRARDCGLAISVPDEVLNQWNMERDLIGSPRLTSEEVANYKRQVGEVILMRGETGDEVLGTVLDAIRTKYFGIIGIDSLSVMLPSVDSEKEVGEIQMRGSNATLLTDFVKKYTPLTNALDTINETTVIGLAQVRANAAKATAGPMGRYMKDWAATGAYAIRHLKSIDIQIHRTGRIEKTIHGSKCIVGSNLNWTIVKGKDGTRDGKSGDTVLYHDNYMPQGTDDLNTILVEAYRRGVIIQSTRGLDIVHPVTRERFDSSPDATTLVKMLTADFDYELTLRHFVLAAANIQCLYRL